MHLDKRSFHVNCLNILRVSKIRFVCSIALDVNRPLHRRNQLEAEFKVCGHASKPISSCALKHDNVMQADAMHHATHLESQIRVNLD